MFLMKNWNEVQYMLPNHQHCSLPLSACKSRISNDISFLFQSHPSTFLSASLTALKLLNSPVTVGLSGCVGHMSGDGMRCRGVDGVQETEKWGVDGAIAQTSRKCEIM